MRDEKKRKKKRSTSRVALEERLPISSGEEIADEPLPGNYASMGGGEDFVSRSMAKER